MMKNLMNENVEPASMKGQATGGGYIGVIFILMILFVFTFAIIPTVNASILSAGLTGAALAIANLLTLVIMVGLMFVAGRTFGLF